MKKLILAICFVMFATPVFAGTFSGFANITSHYISRGTDQNVRGDPSIQAGLTYTSKNGFYASTFASTMDFGEGTTKELDFFGGKKWTIGKTVIDTGFASINYPANHDPLNFIEYDVKVDHPLGKGSVGVWLGYTEHYFHTFGKGYWTEVHASYPITDKLSVSGSVAKQTLPDNFGHFSYATFNVGATYALTQHLSVDLRYSDTDRHNLDPIFNTYGQRLSATITASF